MPLDGPHPPVLAVEKGGLDQPVRSFVIDGPFQRVTAVEVQQAALGSLRGGFVSADLDRLRTAVEALVWVDRARVQRLWPDRLRIEIVEQQAAARWGDDGLLNTRGELFATGVRHPPPELPRLDGPAGTEWQVAQRYLAMQDTGTVINPLILAGQIRGGVAQGIGNAFYEQLVFDEQGQLLTVSLADYLLPTALDVPRIELEHTLTTSPLNPLGIKGAGEAGAIPVGALFAQAIEDALDLPGKGVELVEIPLSPHRLWKLAGCAG